MKSSEKILLVENDVDDQVYFLDAISEISTSIECVIANNGIEALQQLNVRNEFDFIFLDLNMPLMNGFEFLNFLKAEQPFKNIPVVIFTTSKKLTDIERSKELGARLFFTKPTNFNTLCNTLKQIFEGSLPIPAYVL